jgi:hypothetical protein
MFHMSADDAGWLITLIVAVALMAIVAGAYWLWRWALPAKVYPDDAGGCENHEGDRHERHVFHDRVSRFRP